MNWAAGSGKSKNRLIYGGSKTGLMGKLAESVLRSRWHRYAGRNRGDHVKNITAAAGSPCIFYDLGGYDDSIRQFLEHMKAKGFSTDKRQKYIYFAQNLEEIREILEEWEKRMFS